MRRDENWSSVFRYMRTVLFLTNEYCVSPTNMQSTQRFLSIHLDNGIGCDTWSPSACSAF